MSDLHPLADLAARALDLSPMDKEEMRRIREQLGDRLGDSVSQSTLADVLQVSQPTVQRMEAGKSDIPAVTAGTLRYLLSCLAPEPDA